MYVLVACEESQRVCQAFRAKGHIAFSCDVVDASGGHPEWHIKQDVTPLLNGRCTFTTCDGVEHELKQRWDLIIAHPPCTYLTPAGACNIPKHPERIELGFKAAAFLTSILAADCDKICVENPPPMKRFGLPKYNQIVYPYQFGDPQAKRTCFWLKGLPLLKPTNVVEPSKEVYKWYSHSLGKEMTLSKWYYDGLKGGEWSKNRSKTFYGIAEAMAEQWG